MFRYALIHVFIFCIQHGRHQAGELLGYILPNHLFPLLRCDMNVKYPLLQVKVCIGESLWPWFKPLPSIFVNLLEFCRLGDFLSELPWIRYLIGNVNSMIRLSRHVADLRIHRLSSSYKIPYPQFYNFNSPHLFDK